MIVKLVFFILILKFFVLISSSDENIPRWCHRELPSVKGQWREEAPFWQTPNCPNQQFDQTTAYNCLKDRTVYIIGNSIARNYGFALYQLIGGEAFDRQQQKASCMKNGLVYESCVQSYNGVQFKHLFLLYMDNFDYKDRNGFPYFRYQSIDENGNIIYDHLKSGHYTDAIGKNNNSNGVEGNVPDDYAVGSKNTWKEIEDNCEGWHTRDCLKSFFNGSTENDILIFSIGMMQVASYNGQMVGLDVDPIDKRSWLTASAVNFKANLASTFKGKVFRVTMAQANKYMNRHFWTEHLREADKILEQLWTPSSVSSHDQWYSIDQWAINENRDHLYDDNLHFPGPLTDATVQQILNELCPNQGVNKELIEDWASSEINDTIIRVINNTDTEIDDMYYVSVFGYRHKILLQNSSLPWYFKDKLKIDMNVKELNKIWLSPQSIPVLHNNLVFRHQKDNQVWVVKDDCGCRQRFHSGAAFLNRGFDFDNVVILPIFIMNLLPVGDWLY